MDKRITATPNPQIKKMVVIGCSAGGVEALKEVFRNLKPSSHVAVVVVLHVGATTPNILLGFLTDVAGCTVKEAESQEPIRTGQIYFAPSGYHLLVSAQGFFELNVDDLVNYSRPSIDVLFESAADAFTDRVLAVVLTGANQDGAAGAELIQKRGGRVLIQDPALSAYPQMPSAAVRRTGIKEVYSVSQIAEILRQEVQEGAAC